MDSVLALKLATEVRRADPDRYFASLFAPARTRPYLHALYAFNHEVAHVAESVREPMLGAIRLEWWREAAEGAAKGSPRPHDVARGLSALFAETGLRLTDLEAIIAARGFDSSNEHLPDFTALENYLDATGGALMRLAAELLGGDLRLTREAALAFGLTGLLRSLPFHNRRRKLYLPMELLKAEGLSPDEFFVLQNDPRVERVVHRTMARARDHFRAARQIRPRAALPAILPAALVPIYLRRMGKDVPIHRRQMALLTAALKGRL
ncbi:MAG TPA: squalene/phytoene synthase family protein [Rhizomicrobium sp.]|nr:squalene/phytoene synthase family protein [Rhizomicrobium sp.]